METSSARKGLADKQTGLVERFAELAKSIGQAWKDKQYEESAFPECAASKLRESRILETVDADEIIDWLMLSPGVPQQDTHDFGQPPIIVHFEARFFIQVLYWIDGTTSIHQHSFSGAFGVLRGSSLHSSYAFEPDDDVDAVVVSGSLRLLRSELLQRGSVRTITRSELIHSLFHLDRPSVSVVVRTSGSGGSGRQYDYLTPAVAIDPFHKPPLSTIQLRMLETLHTINKPKFWQTAESSLESCSLWMFYRTLALAYKVSDEPDRWNRLLEVASRRFARLTAAIVTCLEESKRQGVIVTLRSQVHDPTHRFFLALLLILPNREAIYCKIQERYPGSDAESLALRWLGEIFHTSRCGLKLTPMTTHLLRLILRDPEFEAVKREMGAFIRPEKKDHDEQLLRNTWRMLTNVEIFRPLLARDSSLQSGQSQLQVIDR